MTLLGGCLCQKVRYTISAEPISQGICYCQHCQKAGGALGSPLLVLLDSNFSCSSADLSSYTSESARGSMVTRHFCRACGSPVFSEISDAPEIITVKAATLDDSDFFKPNYLVWTKSAGPSCVFPAEVPSFPENAPLNLMLSR